MRSGAASCWLAFWVVSCSAAPPPSAPAPSPPAALELPASAGPGIAPEYAFSAPIRSLDPAEARDRYASTRAALEATRRALAARLAVGEDPAHVLAEAHQALFQAIRGELIPAWFGTPWAFFGTSVVPGEGSIACGYFVSTVLEHAGLKVERVHLAKQASERIVRTFTPPDQVFWLRSDPSPAQVASSLPRDGLYVVGLDGHVGFLSRETRQGVATMEFCNSAYMDSEAVACEDPEQSQSFHSRSYVVGELLTEPTLRAWLAGAAIPTWKPERGGGTS